MNDMWSRGFKQNLVAQMLFNLLSEVKVSDPFQFNAEALAPGLFTQLSPVCVSHDPVVHLQHGADLR